VNIYDKLRIHELVLKSMDNEISPAEFAELNQYLSGSSECQQYYNEVIDMYLGVHERLEILASAQTTEPVLEEGLWQSLAESEKNADAIVPTPSLTTQETAEQNRVERVRPRSNKISLYTAIISIAALVLILVSVQWFSRNNRQFCGYVARSIDAKWFFDAAQMSDGAAVYSGPIALEKGLVELIFEGGAKIILQGPIQLNVESSSRIFLDEGNIAVSYEKSNDNERFVVRTPNCCVVDFGTEFGVSVSSSGCTETHVQRGEVELRTGTNPSKYTQSLKLLASQAGRSEADGTLKQIKYEKTKFVYKNEFDTKIRAMEGSDYHRWLAYSYQLRRDPDMVLYYPFLKTEESQSFVTNVAANTGNTLNGNFGGAFGISSFAAPSWTAGRWSDKAALRFERDKRTCVAVPESPALNLAGNITFAAWVRCPDAQKGGHILCNRQGEHVNYQFGCFAAEDPYFTRKLQLLRKDDAFTSTIYSSRLYDWSSEWTFLAVTHDTKTVHFYVNGELFESVPFEYKGQAISAPLIIGDVPSIEGRIFGYAAFNGLMDEIAIFKRVLSADEIKAMYEAGKP
jgi:hypothetical protein